MKHGTQVHSLVAIFDSHLGAEGAIKKLSEAGLDMKRLSIVGKDFQTEEHARGFYTSGDRMKFWGGRGAVWGSLWGVLFGGAFFFVPAVGPLVVMGPLVGWIVGVLEGTAAGAAIGVLGAALASIGIPKDSVIRYEKEVKGGRFLVLAHGSAELVEHARTVLEAAGASQLATHMRSEYVSREAVLKLLSDEEVARVSTAEAAASLQSGDEYLDLEQLERGVRHAPAAATPMGRILPRKALKSATWTLILDQLAAARAAAEAGRP